MAKPADQPVMKLEDAIADRIARFANVLSSAVFAQSALDLGPVMAEVEELLSQACILERLVFTRNVLNTTGVPRQLIERLLADNFLVARMLTLAGFGLDDERTIRLLATRDEAFQIDVASHAGISEKIADYLIDIGGPEVAYRLARNKRARLSPSSVVALVERAQSDHRLLQALTVRKELSADPDDQTDDTVSRAAGLGAKAEPSLRQSKPPRVSTRRSKVMRYS